MTPSWRELAQSVSDVNGLTIAEIDYTENEVENIRIQGFPTLRLFLNNGQVIDYEGERTLEGYQRFLLERSSAYQEHVASKREEL